MSQAAILGVGRVHTRRQAVAKPRTANKRSGVSMLSKLVIAAVGILILTLMSLAVFHALILQTQDSLNDLEIKLAQAEEENINLRNSIDNATAPEKIVSTARDKLGLEIPKTIIYISKTQTAGERE